MSRESEETLKKIRERMETAANSMRVAVDIAFVGPEAYRLPAPWDSHIAGLKGWLADRALEQAGTEGDR